jgi:uncharacterized protein
VGDQRPASARPDVETYETSVLKDAVRVSGRPEVHLVASTSGTDSDWVVKVIDVYPHQDAEEPKMGGYELAISMDIFRGRYRESLSHPSPLTPNKPLQYNFFLPAADHVFLPESPDYGANPIQLVSALPPQPANVCPEHLPRYGR